MDATRRFCGAIAARCANRRFAFSIAAVSLLGGKAIHLYAHYAAISTTDIMRWGLSFFFQDALMLLGIHLLLDKAPFGKLRWLNLIATAVASTLILIFVALSSITISFFFTAGSEPHWRNIGVIGEASAGKMMLTGLLSLALDLVGIFAISWVMQDLLFLLMTLAVSILKSPFAYAWSKMPFSRLPWHSVKYSHIPQSDIEGGSELHSKEDDIDLDPHSEHHMPSRDTKPRSSFLLIVLKAIVGLGMLVLFIQCVARPEDPSLTFMSWTLPLLPFVDFAHSSQTLGALLPVFGNSINYSWDNATALAKPPAFNWLPKEKQMGFEDWYEKGQKHYRGDKDPMRIGNEKNPLLEKLQGQLAGIKIKNIVMIKLESTRKDVFPIKKNNFIWSRAKNSWKNGSLPYEAEQRMNSLTPTANFLTGDYRDGIEHKTKPVRGGINFNNAFTSATYTIKSLTGTICGLAPLVADFNIEWEHHIYQPCLPQIFETFNKLDHSKDTANNNDFTKMPWKSTWMQSVTGTYDKQDRAMEAMGFPKDNTISMEYMKSEKSKFGPPDLPDVNYYGMAEETLEAYVRDTFQTAKQEGKRVFLGHLTSSSHHPFAIPQKEKYVNLVNSDEKKWDEVSKYLNAIGYVDKWLQTILDILEEEHVADETLLVFVGDHGLSVAESAAVTPYYVPNVASFHVPLVLSHPKMPAIKVDDPVISSQILPTILDLLVETGSLGDADSKAARDLIRNYEGQSMIRTLEHYNNHTQQANWQFTIMNPGRAQLSVRDTHRPDLRIVVPIVEDIEWRFTDLSNDPQEKHGVRIFGYQKFLKAVEDGWSKDYAEWCEEAAFMARWWVDENSKRWRFNPLDA